MSDAERPPILAQLRAVNAVSAFNTWAGFEVLSGGGGRVEIGLLARAELRQHAGYLHAGVVAALIDTACGFAAATIAGNVIASQNQIMFYAATSGDKFVVRAKVVKSGKRQVFAQAELFDAGGPTEKLVAGGSAVLVPIA